MASPTWQMKYRSQFKTATRLLRRPAVVSTLVRDLLGTRRAVFEERRHLDSAMQWLCRAQDMGSGGGVSIGWWLKDGWRPAYPETTGYIIPTFLEYATLADDAAFTERAIRMGTWELSIQLPSGAIRGGPGTGEHPLVFDTGQVILGFMALFRETGETRWLEAAQRAGDWIVSLQEVDGSWVRGSYLGIPHSYYTHVAW